MDELDRVMEKSGVQKASDQGQQETQQTEQNTQTIEEPTSQKTDEKTEGTEQQQTQTSQEQETQGGEQTEQKTEEGEKTEEQNKISTDDILKHVNEQTGLNFESFEDIKGLQSNQEKIKEYETKIQQKDEALNSVGDPLKNFANEQLVKTNEILKQNSDLSLSVASKLATADFDNMSDDDVLAFNEIIQNPHYEGQESMVKEMIEEDYGLDVGQDEEMDDRQKRKLERQKMRKQADARKIRENLKQRSNVEVPQAKNVEQEYQQKLEQYRPQAEKIIDQEIDAIKVGKDGYEFKVGDDFKKMLKDDNLLARFLANNDFDPSDGEARQKAIQKVKEVYRNQNFDRIIDDVVEQAKTQMSDQTHKETHNPKENNRQEAPQTSDVEQYNQKEKDRLVADLKS